MRQVALAVLLLTLAVAGCAPVTGGSSARHPLAVGAGVTEVAPGETVYLIVVSEPRELGFNDTDLDSVLFVNETERRRSARADNWMRLTPVRVPAWWDVTLDTSRFVQESSGSSTRTTVQSVLRVTVPAAASLGPAELRLELHGRRDSTIVQVPLRVRQY